ncbi:hypothetical protein [Saccharomonospora saliphila]|uniref:hypothetical protein n=1 Tax=Saccharomonospora saliphila TaxID=369829 RepID=UPI0003688D18|nr:hypothetical protein [Saccharomonospora saliphila]
MTRELPLTARELPLYARELPLYARELPLYARESPFGLTLGCPELPRHSVGSRRP